MIVDVNLMYDFTDAKSECEKATDVKEDVKR